ncbi:MAG TPA: Rne/Rng family ribonuclease [Stellaceae bacterium]|nr:Rne/Rng family ribonuclease [Stellaceae bacterium]
MAKRMLIDAAHPEETRVVVTGGQHLEEFDFESSTKKQVKGNIYLAKITRVEPSLQAAFVDYGGNRHGFLAFTEIHPDYYRIPVSDRDRERDGGPGFAGEANGAAEDPYDDAGVPLAAALPEPVAVADSATLEDEAREEEAREDEARDDAVWDEAAEDAAAEAAEEAEAAADAAAEDGVPLGGEPAFVADPWALSPEAEPAGTVAGEMAGDGGALEMALRAAADSQLPAEFGAEFGAADEPNGQLNGELSGERHGAPNGGANGGAESVETLGGDEVEEVEEADAARRRSHSARHYKIQEVIKRRQIMLVQVGKEERGNKGAALTTYLSLAGRYCVLMPNTNRGGGVSRKIVSLADRRRLKDILEDLEIPEGMGVIVRTAGAERSKAEIKRDYEYLLRLWNEIRELTLKSTAPALIYEEGNLIKRSIRDLYARDIDEVLVEGEEGYKTAKAFMRTLMPSHAKRVQPYRDPQVPLFQRFQIESQIDAIHSPVAQLRSGGYVVINQTEALVSIDVNSGRSTRERNIEETATRTNLEAADEIARQLRLRDLAGLIVIDFIDMEEHRNQVAVERRLKEALKNDRARIQVGRISPFGLLEMSRQRLRPSLAEASTQPCPHCAGTGFIRSVESTALYVLRAIEEEGIRRRSAEICIYVPTNVALYILNQKRESLAQIEARYGVRVTVARDDALIPPNFRLERLRTYGVGEAPPLPTIQAPSVIEEREDEEDEAETETDDIADVVGEAAEARGESRGESGSEEDRARRRRPRRRRRAKEPREARAKEPGEARTQEPREPRAAAEAAPVAPEAGEPGEADGEAEAERRRRRRGRRGGRARPRREEADAATPAVAAETIEAVPLAAGPAEHDSQPAEFAGAEFAAVELSLWAGDAGVETASLAPLAGESGSLHAPQHAAPHAHEAEAAPPPSAEIEAGVPFVSAAERVFEEAMASPAPARHEAPAPEPVPEAAPDPGEDVHAVGEKPANPRRGWWQRLLQ